MFSVGRHKVCPYISLITDYLLFVSSLITHHCIYLPDTDSFSASFFFLFFYFLTRYSILHTRYCFNTDFPIRYPLYAIRLIFMFFCRGRHKVCPYILLITHYSSLVLLNLSQCFRRFKFCGLPRRDNTSNRDNNYP